MVQYTTRALSITPSLCSGDDQKNGVTAGGYRTSMADVAVTPRFSRLRASMPPAPNRSKTAVSWRAAVRGWVPSEAKDPTDGYARLRSRRANRWASLHSTQLYGSVG